MKAYIIKSTQTDVILGALDIDKYLTGQKTVAEQISTRFGDDGQNFEDSSGESIEDVCRAHDQRPSKHGESLRYNFTDKSSIIITDACWDLGHDDRECGCMREGGHTEECEREHSAVEWDAQIGDRIVHCSGPLAEIAPHMDDNLRETLHNELAPCDDQYFLDRYLRAHREKYDEDFVIN